jgi:hypothetical protein
MKKTTMLLLCAFLAGTGMQSCKKDDKKPSSSTNPPVSTPDHFSLTVNGVNTVPPTVDAQEVGGVIACNATLNATTTYTLVTEDALMPGTYPIDGDTQFDLIHSDDNNATYYASTSGSVTILTHDTVNNRMSGTYNCILTRSSPAATKTVTNGQFNFSYN